MKTSKVLKKLLLYLIIFLVMTFAIESSLFTTGVIDPQKLLSLVEKSFVLSYCFAFSNILTDRKKAAPFSEFVIERRKLSIWLFSLIMISTIIFHIIKRVELHEEIIWSKNIFFSPVIAVSMTFIVLLFSGSFRFRLRKDELKK